MYKTPTSLTNWIWRWHIIGGLFTVPVVLLLCITGAIYLFKEDVNQHQYQSVMQVAATNATTLPLAEQRAIAEQSAGKAMKSVTLPTTETETTAFQLEGKGRAANQVRVNPYTGEVAGRFQQKETLMYTIRKLHGELLLDTPGTLVVELVASWFVVLLLTGVYLWWPTRGKKSGVFSIRTKQGKRTFWRDLHAVGGFWFSIGMLVIIAGGMPWTDVFGSNLKWVQAQTDTGYPKHWGNAKGLKSAVDDSKQTPLSIDDIASLPAVKSLTGTITINFPTADDGVYSVRNRSFWLADQQVIHIDQYTGANIKQLTWDEVGILMDLRQVFMRLHQGEYGLANWLIVLALAVLFTVTTLASIVSYLIRKPEKHWGLPRTPKSFKVDATLLSMIAVMGVLFPLFGVSVILITLISLLRSHSRIRQPLPE